MRTTQARAVLTIARSGAGWAVELDGHLFGHSPDKDVCRAAAHRRAQEINASGRPCQVRVFGEAGFFGGV